jgi:hypothetical protein
LKSKRRKTLSIDDSVLFNSSFKELDQYSFAFIHSYEDTLHDKINQYGCARFVNVHHYLQDPSTEAHFWSQSLSFYRSLGLFEAISATFNGTFHPQIFDYLGMQFAADICTHLTSLRDQFPLDEIGFTDSSEGGRQLKYAEWDEIERIVMTRQFGIYDRRGIELQNTRMFMHFISLIQAKVECIA